MTVAASRPACKDEENEAEAYARIAAAIDFFYRASEDVWRRQIRHTLRVSKLWKELNAKKDASSHRPATLS
jgi:hypothetical protein